MNIEIVGILDRGQRDQERLELSVVNDTNLIFFVVYDSFHSSPDTVSAGGRRAYWFPLKAVKTGDSVFLYTGNGVTRTEDREGGGKNHFTYWGLSEPIWSAPESCAIVFQAAEWFASRSETPAASPS